MRHQSDVQLLTGDCVAEIRSMEDASFDAVVTDPPYELGLMRYGWDASGVAHRVGVWGEVLRVMKPGAHLLAFGSPRTYHRLACAIEDAGFEIRDSIQWIYSSGFPKGIDISKAIDRRRCDRDAVLKVTRFVRDARNRSGKTNADIDAHFGTNGMASHWTSNASQPSIPTLDQWEKLKRFLSFSDEMDAEVHRLGVRKGTPGDAWQQRVATGSYNEPPPGTMWHARYGRHEAAARAGERRDDPATDDARMWKGWGTTLKTAYEPIVVARKPVAGSVADNVLQFRTGALNLDACRLASGRLPTNVILDEDAAKQLDQQTGSRKSGARATGIARANRGGYSGPTTAVPSPVCYADEGGPSRFFYVPKASPAERRAGLAENAPRHPTIKPIALIRHLVRLVTPPGGTILDPFTGSGTTGIAAVLEGAHFIGIEREPEYVAVAEARIAHWRGEAHERAA